jgi:translation initiation factor IF-3
MRIHRHRHKVRKSLAPDYRTNEEIDAPEVRLITEEGAEVVSIDKALKMASEADLDLIEISPKAVPPVCKIMDYGSFKYQKEKELKKQRAAQKEVDTKGIRLTLRIGAGDIDVRRKQALKFLEKGNKLRIELVLRGREKAYRDRATEIIQDFIKLLEQDYQIRMESSIKPAANGLQTTVARVN